MFKTPTRIFTVILASILITQFLAGLWHISNPFVDGTLHYNWSAPAWLLRAKSINDDGILKTFLGLRSDAEIAKSSVNMRHPPFTLLVSVLWTRVAGYSEVSIRIISLLLTMLTTFFFALAMRRFLGNRFALIFAVLFASLPLIYIFGRKLDPVVLVLLFFAFYLWGISFFKDRSRISIIIATIGAFGMCLSDWSGFLLVFTGGIAALIAWGWEEDKLFVSRFIISTYAAALTGLFLYLLEIYLQSVKNGGMSIGSVVFEYVRLYKYRASLSASQIEWLFWFKRQLIYLSDNFTIVLAALGIGGLFVSIFISIKRIRRDSNIWILSVFVFSILIGQLVYLFAVSQASFQHIYFQYFLSLPIAFGLTFLILYIANRSKDSRMEITLFLFALVTFFAVVNAGFTYNKMLFELNYGDQSDIELIQSLREIPLEQKIVAIDYLPNLVWFQGPNIKYYAGRSIETYPVNEIQLSPYMIVRSFIVKDIVNFANNLAVEQLRCSTHFCLLQVEEKDI